MKVGMEMVVEGIGTVVDNETTHTF